LINPHLSTRRAFLTTCGALTIAACSSAAQQAGPRTPAGLPADLVPAPNPAFANWSAAFSSRARQAGISAQTRDIFAAQAGYLPGVVTRDGTQIQTRRTLEEYISIATSDERIAKGRAAVVRHRATLDAIAARYGVDALIIAAIWGMESQFGEKRGARAPCRAARSSPSAMAYALPSRAIST